MMAVAYLREFRRYVLAACDSGPKNSWSGAGVSENIARRNFVLINSFSSTKRGSLR